MLPAENGGWARSCKSEEEDMNSTFNRRIRGKSVFVAVAVMCLWLVIPACERGGGGDSSPIDHATVVFVGNRCGHSAVKSLPTKLYSFVVVVTSTAWLLALYVASMVPLVAP